MVKRIATTKVAKKTSFTWSDAHSEYQNATVIKIYSVDFNRNTKLSYKKLFQNMKPFWIYFIQKNQAIW